MPYILTLTNGTSLTTIADNTVNTTSTSLALVGKNYTGYGAFLNENFIKLLENSSNSAAPTVPLVGQLWWDTVNTVIKVWTGNQWKPMHASTASTTNPTNPNTGDLWWNTNALTQGGGLYVWGGSTWVFIGPQQGSSQGSTSGAIPTTIIDSNNQSHSVIELNIANQVLGIISKDAAFTPGAAIPGFGNVYPGFNLINGSGLTGSQFTGNATMALTLGVNGLSANSFMRSDQNTSTTGVLSVVNDTGLAVGNLLSVLTIGAAYSPGSGNSINFTNTTNNSDINLYVKKAGSLTKALAVNGTTGTVNLNTIGALGTTVAFASPITLSGSSTLILNAGTPNVGDIGSSASPFNNVWATTVNGNVSATTAAFQGNVTLANVYVPTANNSPGSKGQISYDSSYVYICVGTNAWRRANLAIW